MMNLTHTKPENRLEVARAQARGTGFPSESGKHVGSAAVATTQSAE